MPSKHEQVGNLVRRGVLLFSGIVPFPASSLVAAIGAAVISKILDIHERRVTEILSVELRLDHISYVEPNKDALLHFYSRNPVYPELAEQFSQEISLQNIDILLSYYPYLYSAFVLKREIPSLLFHREIEARQFRALAEDYQTLSRGYHSLEGNVEVQGQINHFGSQLLEVLMEVYEVSKDRLKTKKNQFAFEWMDYIHDISTL